MTRPKSPPYASDLKKLRKRRSLDNPLRNAHVHCGNDSWLRARTYIDGGAESVAHLCFPKDSEAGDFRWTCLAGLVVTILHASDPPDAIYPPTLEQLAEAIILDGASIVFIVDPKWPVQTYTKKATAA